MKYRICAVVFILIGFSTISGCKNPAVIEKLGPVPEEEYISFVPMAEIPFDMVKLKQNWRTRIEAMRRLGKLPIIDIESSYRLDNFDIKSFAKQMDKHGIALIAFSVQTKRYGYWDEPARMLLYVDPWRYIPVTPSGVFPLWTEEPEKFLAQTKLSVLEASYPLMGEFEFRHYPSPREYKSGAMYRDVTVPINGKEGHILFAFAEKSGVPFQIHYEIEDKLLPPLEEMLKKYPEAKVIWCHLAQIRYQDRSSIYNPAYVQELIENFPNLYFDLAFGGPNSVYPGSGQHHARVWNQLTKRAKKEWIDLIADHPWRFLAALDLGSDRMDALPRYTSNLRKFLNQLPRDTREIVAYKAAWKLLFNENI